MPSRRLAGNHQIRAALAQLLDLFVVDRRITQVEESQRRQISKRCQINDWRRVKIEPLEPDRIPQRTEVANLRRAKRECPQLRERTQGSDVDDRSA